VNFVCDEGVDRSIVQRLRAEGHEVVYIAELSPSVPDEEVLREANERGAVLVTMDKDFGELVFRLGKLTTGILLVRAPDVSSEDRATLVAGVIREHGGELPAAFAVVSETKLRIRKPH
jgi:predicted nuclease of predicted toxin-antitoxin system